MSVIDKINQYEKQISDLQNKINILKSNVLILTKDEINELFISIITKVDKITVIEKKNILNYKHYINVRPVGLNDKGHLTFHYYKYFKFDLYFEVCDKYPDLIKHIIIFKKITSLQNINSLNIEGLTFFHNIFYDEKDAEINISYGINKIENLSLLGNFLKKYDINLKPLMLDIEVDEIELNRKKEIYNTLIKE